MRPTPAAPPRAVVTITSAILERLEAGVRPWVRPWTGSPPPLPLRACGTPYAGINLFWLWLVAEQRGFSSPTWMTYAQARRLGGQVRRGERAAVAVFYKPPAARAEDADEGRSRARPVLRSYAVFNADQIEGLGDLFAPEPRPCPPAGERQAMLEAFFAALPGPVRLGGNRAFYDPAADMIALPPPARSRSPEAFYATLAHERAHWTGHPCRLARDFGRRFGDRAYALEELSAELASAILGAELGLPVDHLDDHAAYLGAWIAAIRAHPSVLLTVASRAQAAADLLLMLGRPSPPEGRGPRAGRGGVMEGT